MNFHALNKLHVRITRVVAITFPQHLSKCHDIQLFGEIELSADFGLNIATKIVHIDNWTRPVERNLIGNTSRMYITDGDLKRGKKKIRATLFTRVASRRISPEVDRKFALTVCHTVQTGGCVLRLKSYYSIIIRPESIIYLSLVHDEILLYEYTINAAAARNKCVNWIDYFCYSPARPNRRVNDGSNSKWNWFGWSGLRSGSRGRTAAICNSDFNPLMLTPRSHLTFFGRRGAPN